MGQEFAEYLKQYEAQGQKFENLTPEQYAARGLAGASYDVHGNIQFAPPGMTPEEAFQDMEKACEYYENLGVEEYMAEIDQALEDNDDSDRVDPLDKAFEHGGVHKNPGLLDGINKMVADSVDSLHQMGYTRDMETGDWTAPPDAEDVEREEALRSAFAIEALKTGGGARQTLQLIDDTEDDGCRARAVRDMDAGPSDEEDDFGGAGERLEATMHDME